MSFPWQQGSLVVELDWPHPIAQAHKCMVRCKHFGNISYASRVIANFVSNFVFMATGVGRGRLRLVLILESVPKPLIRCKDLGDIFYTSLVIAHFVSKFNAMATGVIEGQTHRKRRE